MTLDEMETEDFEFRHRWEQEHAAGEAERDANAAKVDAEMAAARAASPQSSREKWEAVNAAGWDDVLLDIPANIGRTLANEALALGPNVANIASTVGDIAGLAVGQKPGWLLDKTYVEPVKVEDLGVTGMIPEGKQMTPGQRVAHTAGTVAGMAPIGSPLTKGKAVLDTLKLAGTGGLSGAAMESTTQATGNPYLGLAAGLLTPAGVAVGEGIGKWGAGLGSDIMATLPPRRGSDWANEHFGREYVAGAVGRETPENQRRIADALANAEAPMPGLDPTSAQAIAAAQLGKGTPQFGGGLLDLAAYSQGSTLGTKLKGQEEAMIDAMERMALGGTRAEREAAQGAVRAAGRDETDPMFRYNAMRANQANEQLPGLLGARDDLTTAANTALQQEGRLLTGAAQSEASVVPRPPLGPIETAIGERMPPGGILGLPARGQYPTEQRALSPLQIPRIPETGITGQALAEGAKLPINRMVKLKNAEDQRAAAREFAESRRDIIGDRNQIESQIDMLAAEGLTPLKAKPLTDAIDAAIVDPKNKTSVVIRPALEKVRKAVARGINKDGSIHPDALMTIRSEMNTAIEAALKDVPKAERKRAAGELAGLKKTIDGMIVKAGGDTWELALSKHAQYAEAVDGLRLKGALLEKLRPGEGQFNPKAFLDATDPTTGATDKLLKSLKIDPKLHSMESLLSPDEMTQIKAIREQLLRDQKLGKIGGELNTAAPTPRDVARPKQVPNTLDPRIGLLNFVLRQSAGKNNAGLLNYVEDAMADPAKLRKLLPVVPGPKPPLSQYFRVPAATGLAWENEDPYNTARTVEIR